MELLKNNSDWFLSQTGCAAFSKLSSLEDRSIFLYSYLKTIAKPEFDKDRVLFKIAFFLADGVMGSSLPYQAYPALIDPKKNPFVAYLSNAERCPGKQIVYFIYLGILHQIADPMKRNDWVYDEQLEDPEYLEAKLTELGKCFYADAVDMVSAEVFSLDPSLETLQLKLIWLLGQS